MGDEVLVLSFENCFITLSTAGALLISCTFLLMSKKLILCTSLSIPSGSGMYVYVRIIRWAWVNKNSMSLLYRNSSIFKSTEFCDNHGYVDYDVCFLCTYDALEIGKYWPLSNMS